MAISKPTLDKLSEKLVPEEMVVKKQESSSRISSGVRQPSPVNFMSQLNKHVTKNVNFSKTRDKQIASKPPKLPVSKNQMKNKHDIELGYQTAQNKT